MEANTGSTSIAELEAHGSLPELNLSTCEFVVQERAVTPAANSQLFLKRAEDGSVVSFNVVNRSGHDGTLNVDPEIRENRATLQQAVSVIARTDRLYVTEEGLHAVRPKVVDVQGDSEPEPRPTQEYTVVSEEEKELFTIHSLRGAARVGRKIQLENMLEELGGTDELNGQVKQDEALAVELYLGDNLSTVVKLVGFANRDAVDPVTGDNEVRTVAVLQDRFGSVGYQPANTLVTNLVAKQPES